MTSGEVIVLTGSAAVVQAVGARHPGKPTRTATCLETLEEPPDGSLIYVDPRVADPCCLKRLREWRRDHRKLHVTYLSLPASPATLLELSSAFPGKVESLADLRASRPVRRREPRSRLAWQERQRVLSWQPQDARQRQFLSLAFGAKGFGRSESEIAREMGMSTRHLCRLVRGWLGYTPKVVLDLIRLDNVAATMNDHELTLAGIASTFGYGTRRTLTRQFRAFTGVPPSVHRRHATDTDAAKADALPSVGFKV